MPSTQASTPDLTKSLGRWVSRRLLVWPKSALPDGLDPESLDWRLHWSASGGIDVWAAEPIAWHSAALKVRIDPLPDLGDRLPHVAQLGVVLAVPEHLDAADVLRGQVVVVASHQSGRLVNASGVQTAGVLDDLYAAAAQAHLGVTVADGVPTLRVWAPTAQEASVLLWPSDTTLDADPVRLPMRREPDGCWAASGDAAWLGARYLYEVTVFVPEFGRVVTNQVTDPYSVALAENSSHSVVIDLDDAALAPAEWRATPQPTLGHGVDQVIYELHVRDFSWADKTLPDELRGTYRAFAADGLGARHLRRLAASGLNTVQLMPLFDFTSSEENRGRQSAIDKAVLRSSAPDSDAQQHYVRQSATRRGFNWGYDPWHYLAPEGSYATASGVNGGRRVREVREMIGALHAMGLRVVLDQVFNHTSAHGQSANSVLGRLVPGYYHRRNESGEVYTSTCCPNVATEHLMAAKLMVDACVTWAKHYRVDGFRFDLMGHHSRANMLAVRQALDALTLERDGVDGRRVTLHGEGWRFGEVAHNALFVQAAQGELGGTHIATFNDRIRDAVRGGGPFDADPRLQGFGTGLFTAPNAAQGNGSASVQRDRLLLYTDWIQVSLAGGLREFAFTSARSGRPTLGRDVDYNGSSAAYADAPDEVLNYVDAHDNETLFDAVNLKLPLRATMAERIRANLLCLAVPTLGQSPVMWHAGTDFLRSKSFDRNSYDSGDWFNYLDFSLVDNGHGAGLPPAADNASRWSYLKPLLGMPELKPAPADMRHAHALACDLLRLRASSRLFRLGDADAVRAKLSFPVSGSWAQVPGVIVMLLDDTLGVPVDERFSRLVVVFNASPWPVRQNVATLNRTRWRMHPVQAEGADPIVKASGVEDGVFMVPGLTSAVFVELRTPRGQASPQWARNGTPTGMH